MYDNFHLIPKLCTVSSRSECSTIAKLGGYPFILPVIPSNMESVINRDLARKLAEKGYFYILHRFIDYTKIIEFVKQMNERGLLSSISVGVKTEDFDLIKRLARKVHPHFITIDVAHGHSHVVAAMISIIKANLPDTFIIAGNVGTPEAVLDLTYWGADAVKIGIGPGKACETYQKTGFTAHPVEVLPSVAGKIDSVLIADGGVKYHGDIAKALALGADFVMCGSLLAGHRENSNRIFIKDGIEYTLYSGSTANNTKHIEGKHIEVPVNGSIFDTLLEIKQDLQSAISYSGGKDLSNLRNVSIKHYP